MTMREETAEHDGPLRTGWTTGANATAAASAAAQRLLLNRKLERVHLWLPKARETDLPLADCRVVEPGHAAEAGLIKDAGDDPDATHGARVWVRLELAKTPGVVYKAGMGVGTVTRAGLELAVGEPAINPVPRRLIAEHLQRVADEADYTGGFEVTVGVDDGETIAKKTMNPRLGILGGLSILGTTGVVRPFSCASFIASIHQGIDVARANQVPHVAACTGGTSESVAQRAYGLPDMAIIEMGDFAGAVLKYLKHHPIERVTLVGGMGKFSKLAAGRLDLHSGKGGVDFEFLAGLAQQADGDTRSAIANANTSLAANEVARQAGVDLAARVADQAWHFACGYVSDATELELWVIDKPGNVLARHAASGAIQQPAFI